MPLVNSGSNHRVWPQNQNSPQDVPDMIMSFPDDLMSEPAFPVLSEGPQKCHLGWDFPHTHTDQVLAMVKNPPKQRFPHSHWGLGILIHTHAHAHIHSPLPQVGGNSMWTMDNPSQFASPHASAGWEQDELKQPLVGWGTQTGVAWLFHWP